MHCAPIRGVVEILGCQMPLGRAASALLQGNSVTADLHQLIILASGSVKVCQTQRLLFFFFFLFIYMPELYLECNLYTLRNCALLSL